MDNYILTKDVDVYDNGQKVATAPAGTTVRGHVRQFGVLSFPHVVGERMLFADADAWEYRREGGQNG